MPRLLALTAVLLSLLGMLFRWELFVGGSMGQPATFFELPSHDHILFGASVVLGLWCTAHPRVNRWLVSIPAMIAAGCLAAIAATKQGVVLWDGETPDGQMTGGMFEIFPGPGAWLGLVAALLYVAVAVLHLRRGSPSSAPRRARA